MTKIPLHHNCNLEYINIFETLHHHTATLNVFITVSATAPQSQYKKAASTTQSIGE